MDVGGHAEETRGRVTFSLRGVGKTYRLFDRPQDRLKELLFSPLKREYGRAFRALRDVSLELRAGETLGVIGRNGSGKSTLLQIMAGIIPPTEGEIRQEGRVAALLELGSGFNPEFTGRENVFTNAAILGLSPSEVRARFDQIAEFADIEEFIDRPVKLYSSGMFLRLAFAVSVSVEADVLLIDEALAVGDVFFRQKCYRRLEELRARGVAIVLVSHAMTEVEQFCERALLLDRGEPLFYGSASEAVKRYYLIEQGVRGQGQERSGEAAERLEASPPDVDGPAPLPAEALFDLETAEQVTNGQARCTRVGLVDAAGRPQRVFAQGELARFVYEFELRDDLEVPIGGVVLQNDKGIIVHGKSTLEYGSDVPVMLRRGQRISFSQEIALELAPGEYTFEVGLAGMRQEDYARCGDYPHPVLRTKISRMAHVPSVGHFAVVFRKSGTPVQLLHHGVANLPGSCAVHITEEP